MPQTPYYVLQWGDNASDSKMHITTLYILLIVIQLDKADGFSRHIPGQHG